MSVRSGFRDTLTKLVNLSNTEIRLWALCKSQVNWNHSGSDNLTRHHSCPMQPDILNPPLLRLTSRKPLWLDLQPIDIKSRWRHNWKSAQVVNSHLVCDPTIRQPGFDLPRQQWSLLNRFHTEQGHCGACRRKWRLTDTDLCPCGETQTSPTLWNPVPVFAFSTGIVIGAVGKTTICVWRPFYGGPLSLGHMWVPEPDVLCLVVQCSITGLS